MVRFVRVVVGPHFIDIQLHLWVLFKQLQKMIHASIRPSAVLSLPGLISIPNSLIDSYWIITKGLKAEICRMGFQCSEKRLNGLLRVECFLSRAVSSRVTRGQETLRVRRNQKKTQTAAGSTVTKKRANALRASDRFVFFFVVVLFATSSSSSNLSAAVGEPSICSHRTARRSSERLRLVAMLAWNRLLAPLFELWRRFPRHNNRRPCG